LLKVSATYRFPNELNIKSLGLFKPVAKVDWVPPLILAIELKLFATKRLPLLSKAIPVGLLKPDAKIERA
jgi:hypothetical protein